MRCFNIVPAAFAIWCMTAGAAMAEFLRVHLADGDDTTFRIMARDGEHPITFPAGPVPLPQGASALSCSMYFVAGDTPGSHTEQDLDVFRGDKQVGLGAVQSEADAQVEIALDIEVCDALSKQSVALRIGSESPASDRTYWGSGADVAARKPRIAVRYSAPDMQQNQRPPLQFSALSNGSLATARVPVEGVLVFQTNTFSDGRTIRGVARPGDRDKLFELQVNGAITVVDLPHEITQGSFAAAGVGRATNILGNRRALSCDPQDLVRNAGCKVFQQNDVGLGTDHTSAATADGALIFRNVDEAGLIMATNHELRPIWRSQKRYDTVGPIALGAYGRQVFILGKLETEDGTRIELDRIAFATGQSFDGTEVTDAQDVAPLFEALFQPAVKTRETNGYITHRVAVAGNTGNTGGLYVYTYTETRPGTDHFAPPEYRFSVEGRIGAPPRWHDQTPDRFVTVLNGKLVEIAWQQSGEEAEITELLDIPDQERGDIFFDQEGSAYFVTRSYLCASHLARCFNHKVPAGFEADGIVFVEDRMRLHGRQGIFELSPWTSDGTISPERLPGSEILAARKIILTQSAKPEDGVARVRLRAGEVEMSPGFHWPQGKALNIDILHGLIGD